VHQNSDDPPFVMAGVDPQQFAIMIDKAAGENLVAFLASWPAAITVRPQAELLQFVSIRDRIAGFSGRGPTLNGDLKPDMVAPGNSVFAASSLGAVPTYSYSLSGTSFSTPIVAGAAALLLQLHPSWSPEALKSSLVNTAERTTTWNGGTAGVIHAGGGRLNVERAAATAAMLLPVSVSFEVCRELPGSDLERTIEVKNLANTGSRTFQPELIESVPHPNVQLSVSPAALSLGPGQAGQFVLRAQLSGPLQYGVFEGLVRVSTPGTTAAITAPYWGGIAVEDRDSFLQVSATGQGPHTSISSGLAAARPGGTVEIVDSSEYPEQVSLALNGDGIPLHGITLRGKPGKSPRIVASDFENPALSVTGLSNVTIDGISIRGGMAGLMLYQASGRVSNANIGLAGYGMVCEDSRFDLLNTTITGATETGLFGFHSRLNVADSTILNSEYEGVVLYASPALIQRSTIGQNKAEGIVAYLMEPLSLFDSVVEKNGSGVVALEAPALLKGNIIRESAGSEPDGIVALGTSARLDVRDTQILTNGRHGLVAGWGADVRVLRGRFQQNQDTAFHISEGSGSIKSSFLIENSRGAIAESSDLTITDTLISASTDTTQGDGLSVDKGSLTLLNSTLAGNRRKGIRILGGATHQIANSIFYNNSAGDAEGVLKGSAFSNLINDSNLGNSDENFNANPRFTGNPDYSLRQDSPAIDRASDTYPISLTDVRGFERTVGSKTDLGAFEYGAESWTPLVLPVLSTRADEFVGLAFVNTSLTTSRVRLTHYDSVGRALGTYIKEVGGGAQFSLLLTEAFQNLKEGWVEIRSDRPDLMSFSLLGNWALSRMDGADLGAAISSRLLFPEVRAKKSEGKETTLYIVNPNSVNVHVALKWQSGQGVVTYNLPMTAKGSLKVPFSEKFPESDLGYLTAEVQEGLPIFGMEIFGTAQSVGGLLAFDMTNPSDTLFGAQLASTGDVETIVNLVNLGPAAATAIEAYDEAGTLKHSRTVNLSAGQQYKKSAREIFGLTGNLVGWLQVRARGAGLIGSVTFSDSRGAYLASLPLQGRGSREFVLGHVAETPTVFTGITLLNSSEGRAQVSLEVFDREGTSKGLSLLELKPMEKRARLLSEYVLGLQAQEGGFIRVRSTLPIFGFELFARYDLTFMSAVPQQVVVR
jgi:hypothetical protein